jgi:hypothetical protein
MHMSVFHFYFLSLNGRSRIFLTAVAAVSQHNAHLARTRYWLRNSHLTMLLRRPILNAALVVWRASTAKLARNVFARRMRLLLAWAASVLGRQKRSLAAALPSSH